MMIPKKVADMPGGPAPMDPAMMSNMASALPAPGKMPGKPPMRKPPVKKVVKKSSGRGR